tara:strand:- start:241 stop:588 length:348 start_codon:yes stop_codon:yes gene_type:complete
MRMALGWAMDTLMGITDHLAFSSPLHKWSSLESIQSHLRNGIEECGKYNLSVSTERLSDFISTKVGEINNFSVYRQVTFILIYFSERFFKLVYVNMRGSLSLFIYLLTNPILFRI